MKNHVNLKHKLQVNGKKLIGLVLGLGMKIGSMDVLFGVLRAQLVICPLSRADA